MGKDSTEDDDERLVEDLTAAGFPARWMTADQRDGLWLSMLAWPDSWGAKWADRRRDIKQRAELEAMGGHFYEHEGHTFCETPGHSWVLIPGAGFLRCAGAGLLRRD
jgi:hypothetical protein